MSDEVQTPGAPPEKRPLLERLTREEKVLAGCSLGTVLTCFFPWYSVSAGGFGSSAQGIDFTWGVLALLTSFAAGGLVVGLRAEIVHLDDELARKIPFFAAVASAACVLLYLLFGGPRGMAGEFREMQEAMGVSAGKTVWPWIALVLMGTAAGFAKRRRAEGGPD